MTAGQILLEIGHCVHIYGMGQSMLGAPQPHTVRRTKRQLQDDEITIDGRGTCVDGSTHSRDIIDPTTTRPVEAKAFEESSKFEHCILARTQQNITMMRSEGRSYEYSNEIDASRGVRTIR